MIDGKAKEKIDAILNKDLNITPKQIAESYLAEKKWDENMIYQSKQRAPRIPDGKAVNKSMIGSLFTRKTSFPNKFIAMIDFLEKHNKPIPKGFNTTKSFLTIMSNSNLKRYVDQLSKQTKKELEDNYDVPTMKKVVEAIIDFERPIITSILAKDLVNNFTKIANKSRVKKKVLINACNILSGSPPLTNHEREIIRAIKNRLESQKYIEMTALKEMELYICLFPLPSLQSSGNNEWVLLDWFNMSLSRYPDSESLVYILQFTYKRKRGCPRDIIFVALQKVIYELLALETEPKKVKHGVKKWAQELSARIINESYNKYIKDLPKLTQKDINNTIHLKNEY